MTTQSPPSIARSFPVQVTTHRAYPSSVKGEDGSYRFPTYSSAKTIPSSFSRHKRRNATFSKMDVHFFHRSGKTRVELETQRVYTLHITPSSVFECEIQVDGSDDYITLRKSARADLAMLSLLHSLEGRKVRTLKQFSLSLDLTTVRRSADWPDTDTYSRHLELALCTHLVIRDVLPSRSKASSNLSAEIRAALGRHKY